MNRTAVIFPTPPTSETWDKFCAASGAVKGEWLGVKFVSRKACKPKPGKPRPKAI